MYSSSWNYVSELRFEGKEAAYNHSLERTRPQRACVVNLRTTLSDIEALPEIVVRIGREVDSELRPKFLSLPR